MKGDNKVALSNSQYESIIRSYEERQIKNRHLLNERISQVYAMIPAYKELEDTMVSISVSQGKKLLNGEDDALIELRKILKELSMTKINLLLKHGFDEHFLDPIYDCPDCGDTGYIDDKKCHCFKQSIISLLYKQSNIQNMIDGENFSSLSYEYFEGEDLAHFKKLVLNCQTFVNNFNSDYQNLFFYGTVGTGKSFLSNCIAKELLENGYSVIYFSSSTLFDGLSKNSFDYKAKEELASMLDDLYNCDLLIIDDLGTEMTNSFVTSQLFSCLNERHMRKKSTIISTNLTLGELQNHYSDRVFSRITSNYEICKLSGPDIRVLKKRLINRK